MNRRVRTVVFAVILAGCLLVLGVVGMAGIAFGGDQPTVIYPEEETQVAQQGETFHMHVMVNSHGGYNEAGVAHLTLTGTFETDTLTVVETEVGSYLEQGEETDVYDETAIDNEAGEVTVEQWRDPEAGGSIGHDHFATITFEVSPDAPEGNTTVSFEDSEVELIGDYFIHVYSHDATISIEEDEGDAEGGTGATSENDSSLADAAGTETVVALVVASLALVGIALAVRKRARTD